MSSMMLMMLNNMINLHVATKWRRKMLEASPKSVGYKFLIFRNKIKRQSWLLRETTSLGRRRGVPPDLGRQRDLGRRRRGIPPDLRRQPGVPVNLGQALGVPPDLGRRRGVPPNLVRKRVVSPELPDGVAPPLPSPFCNCNSANSATCSSSLACCNLFRQRATRAYIARRSIVALQRSSASVTATPFAVISGTRR
jgi:hypothetical protein